MTRPLWIAPIIPKRIVTWEAGYVATLERHMAQVFAWGRSDCLTRAADLCEAMTGVDPMVGLRSYRSAEGAGRMLLALGFTSVEDALNAVFPRIAKVQARRGDAGVLEQLVDGQVQLVTLTVIGAIAVGKGADGENIAVPRSALRSAYAIGAL